MNVVSRRFAGAGEPMKKVGKNKVRRLGKLGWALQWGVFGAFSHLKSDSSAAPPLVLDCKVTISKQP